MVVLIADRIAAEGIDTLTAYPDVEVVVKTGLAEDQLLDAVAGCTGLVVRSATNVTRRVIEAADGLKVIGRAGAGVDNIDVEAASRRDIVVMNTPGGNARAAAELTVAMMFAVVRHIARANASMKAGQWDRGSFAGTELGGKTLGLIGAGHVGRLVGTICRGIGMDVVAYDPFLDARALQPHGIRWLPLDDLLKTADVISCHAPRDASTVGMIGSGQFAKMKDGVYLIQCSRGGVVDESALLDALDSGTVAGAGLDVFEQEPPGLTPLVGHPAVTTTPHIGASTAESQVTVAVMVARQLGDFLTAGTVLNAVNR